VIEFIRDFYNTTPNKGTDEPSISTSGDGINFIETVPDNIVNIYDFTKEISFYDAIMHVIRRLNQPIGQGGVGDFYSLVFTDGEGLITPQADTIIMQIFVQGVGTVDTVQSSINNPFHSLTYQIESESGNQILVRGQQGTGYVPKEFHEFISHVEEINNYPTYKASETYKIGIFTRGTDNIIYKAILAVPINTPPPNVTFWLVQTPDLIIGTLNYSQWTKNKVTVTKNGMSNPTAAFVTGGFAAPAFYDGNMVIREGGTNSIDGTYTFWRDWATIRTNTTVGIATNKYLDFAVSPGLYNGFRVLVDVTIGAVGGDFVGSDKFGRVFADSIAVYNGDEWIVIREFDGIPTVNRLGNQCVVIFEGRTFEWNTALTVQNDFANAHTHATWNPRQRSAGAPTGVQWRDVSASAGGNDVFHHPKSITSVTGLFPGDIIGDDYTTFTANSALKIVFEFDLDSILDEFLNKFTTWWDNLYTFGKNLMEGVDDNFPDEFEPTIFSNRNGMAIM